MKKKFYNTQNIKISKMNNYNIYKIHIPSYSIFQLLSADCWLFIINYKKKIEIFYRKDDHILLIHKK